MARCDCAEDVRLYRNLLALMPYAVHVQKVVLPAKPRPTAVVYYRPSSRRPGRLLGWW